MRLLCLVVSLTVPSEVPLCVRNLPTASNTKDCPDNIHVKPTNRLESLFYYSFNVPTRKILACSGGGLGGFHLSSV